MARADWWRGAVIYQIYPRSFFDSNGDGIGDLPGITAHLEHVAWLGADAVWLCPFFVSPQQDFGYDVADYTAVDPIFGTLADFVALLRRAHELGLKVLIDQVWSHTSDHHPWFRASRASRTNPRSDWYVWADPSPDGTPPNNWLSVFGGSAWRWEPRRRQYYLHHFLAQQPALNLHNPAVMDALLATGDFWLRRGVDGFRLDAIDFLLHDPALTNNPPAPPPRETPAKLFGLQLHRHDMMQAGTTGLLGRIRGLLDRHPGRVALGELSSQPGAFQRVVASTSGNDWLHMAYTLQPLRSGFDWPAVTALLREVEAAQDEGWFCWSFSNHDVERAASRWNPRRGETPPDPAFARLLMALLLSLRGSVCLYQGEELGLTEAALGEDQLRIRSASPIGRSFGAVTAAARPCHGRLMRRMPGSRQGPPGCPWHRTISVGRLMRRWPTTVHCCTPIAGFWRSAGRCRRCNLVHWGLCRWRNRWLGFCGRRTTSGCWRCSICPPMRCVRNCLSPPRCLW